MKIKSKKTEKKAKKCKDGKIMEQTKKLDFMTFSKNLKS